MPPLAILSAVLPFVRRLLEGLATIAGRALANPDVLVAGLAIGYGLHVWTSWNDVPNALAKAQRESRAAADAIDAATLRKQLDIATADRDKLILLRDQDNAEDAEQIAELEREIAAGIRPRCLPTDADRRRLRLR